MRLLARPSPEDFATIARDVGALLLLQAALMTASVLVALVFREWYAALAFFAAGGVTAGVGGFANRRYDDAPDPKIKHGMVIAAAGWFCTALFGALPFLFAAHFTPPTAMAAHVPAGAEYARSSLVVFRDPLNAFFESMSGWTGSGLTMATHEPSLPRSVQWWRSLIQYVGGVGVIVLTVAILARPGSGSYALYRSEAREQRIHPSIINTVRTVWRIFVAYSVLSVIALFVAIRASEYGAALPLWEAGWQALNHGMTGLSTGGFSVTDDSIATYDSPLIEAVLLPVMTLGAIAFPVHYAVLRERDFELLRRDAQTRLLFLLFGFGVVGLTLQNVVSYEPSLAFRDSAFQFISALSCTGFQSAPIGDWPDGGKLIVSGAMVLGGAAGSTAGGIKLIRGYTIAKGIQWQFSKVFLPTTAVVAMTVGDRRLSRAEMDREFSEAAIVTLLWLLLLLASSLALVNLAGPDFSYADALFEVASAQGNVGLSTGITGPGMHPLAKGMFVLNMWVGRLEILPVLVFFRALLYGLDP